MSQKILDAIMMSGSPRSILLSGLTLQFGQEIADPEDNGKYLPSRLEPADVKAEPHEESDLVPQLTVLILPILKSKRRMKSSISVAFNFVQNITLNKRPSVLDYGQLRSELLPRIESVELAPGTNGINQNTKGPLTLK